MTTDVASTPSAQSSKPQADFYQLCFDGKGPQASLSQMRATVVRTQPIMRKSLFKIVLLGDNGVGKTELFCRLAKLKQQERPQNYKSRTTDFEITPGEFTMVEFVDAENSSSPSSVDDGGHSILSQRIPRYFDASGVLLAYDVWNRATFRRLADFLQHIRLNIPPDAEVFLIGNKADKNKSKETTEDRVTFDEADRFAAENGLSLFEIDATTGRNVNEAVCELLLRIRDRMDITPFDVDAVEFDGDSSSTELNNNGNGVHRNGLFKKHTAASVANPVPTKWFA